MPRKNQHIQLRLSASDKAYIQTQADLVGLDMSRWILQRLLPQKQEQFLSLVNEILHKQGSREALAELNDFLTQLEVKEFACAVERFPTLSPQAYLANYISAMVELAAHQKGTAPPAWTILFTGLLEPHFATTLPSVRLHLLRASPPPFKRRRIFIDTSLGGRV